MQHEFDSNVLYQVIPNYCYLCSVGRGYAFDDPINSYVHY